MWPTELLSLGMWEIPAFQWQVSSGLLTSPDLNNHKTYTLRAQVLADPRIFASSPTTLDSCPKAVFLGLAYLRQAGSLLPCLLFRFTVAGMPNCPQPAAAAPLELSLTSLSSAACPPEAGPALLLLNVVDAQ